MTEGSRYDTLDDHAAVWNWHKITKFGMWRKCGATQKFNFNVLIIDLGTKFTAQMKKAVCMRDKHRTAFNNFNNTFPASVVATWDRLVTDWDADKSKPNPYEEPVACMLLCFILFYTT